MKKQTLLILGVVAVAGFFAWKKGLFGKKTQTTEPGEPAEPETTDESETPGKPVAPGTAPATIIDVTKGNITVPEAIEQAKSIVENVKNVKVLIKTPPGQKNIKVQRKEAKKVKRAEKKAKRKEKKKAKQKAN